MMKLSICGLLGLAGCFTVLLGTTMPVHAAAKANTVTERDAETMCNHEPCGKDMQKLITHALDGSSDAQVIVAAAFADSELLPKDSALARQFAQRAARHRDPRAYYMLSVWIRGGFGFEADAVEAEKHLIQAAERDFAPALYDLAVLRLELKGKDNSESVALLQRAVDKHRHKPSRYLLAQLEAGGIGVKQDLVSAAKHFHQLRRSGYQQSEKRYRAVRSVVNDYAKTDKELPEERVAVDMPKDIEVITVVGQRWSIEDQLTSLVMEIKDTGYFEGHTSAGTRIRGQVCGQGVANCRTGLHRKANVIATGMTAQDLIGGML